MRHNGVVTKKDGSQVEFVSPDGGWGWMVVVGNCILTLVIPTLSFGYGIVYVSLVEQQNISHTAATGITALILGITSLFGPFATALATYYSHRALSLIGVICVFMGLLLASFSLNIIWLYFCFTLAAFGNAMSTPQSFLIGQKYFTKKRVTVHSIASIAFSLGYVLIPACLLYLIHAVSIRGTLLIWAGIVIHGAIGAMLYQPVQKHLIAKPIPKIPLITFSEPVVTHEKEFIQNSLDDTQDDSSSDQQIDLHIEEDEPQHFKSLLTNGDDGSLAHRDHNFRSKEIEKRISFLSAFSEESFHTVRSHFKSLELISMAPSEYFDTMGSMLSLRSIGPRMSLYGAQQETMDAVENGDMSTQKPKIEDPRPLSPCLFCGLILPGVFDMLQFRLLFNAVFLIICLGSAFNRQIYFGYLSLLPVISNSLGYKEKTPILLMILAIVEILTKLCVALASTNKRFPSRFLYMLSLLTNCFAIIAIAYSETFMSLCIGTSILGIGTGVASCIGPVLLVEYLGIDELPYSYGMLLLVTGIMSFIVLPVQGWTIDVTGSTKVACLIFAAMSAMAFILWLLMPLAQKFQRKRRA